MYDDGDVLEVHQNAAVSSVSVLAGGGGGAAAASYASTGIMIAPPVVVFGAEGDALFTHCDDLGNVLALTDAAGTVVERYDYGDYGAPSFFDAAGASLSQSAVGNDYLFQGMLWEPETGFYHRSNNPLYEDKGSGGANPLHGSTRSVNPTFQSNAQSGSMPGSRGSKKGGGGTFQECFVSSYSMCVDPQTGRTLSRLPDPCLSSNPWSLKKEEGGRHTPFHNKYRPQFAQRVSNVLKTKHDTAKNSVGNIR